MPAASAEATRHTGSSEATSEVIRQRRALVEALAQEERPRVPAPGGVETRLVDAARRLSESTFAFVADSANRRWNVQSTGEVRLATAGTLFLLYRYGTDSTAEFNVPLQIWSEDARAAEVTEDGLVRFVLHSRSPATFIVEPAGDSVHDGTTVKIRRAPPAVGWVAVKAGRLAIQPRPVTFQLKTIVLVGEKP
jgi:hypothetical protein